MITELIITKQKFLFKKIYHDCLYKFSSNINEVIRLVLNFLIFFTKRYHKYKKAQNRLQWTKTKKCV